MWNEVKNINWMEADEKGYDYYNKEKEEVEK